MRYAKSELSGGAKSPPRTLVAHRQGLGGTNNNRAWAGCGLTMDVAIRLGGQGADRSGVVRRVVPPPKRVKPHR